MHNLGFGICQETRKTWMWEAILSIIFKFLLQYYNTCITFGKQNPILNNLFSLKSILETSLSRYEVWLAIHECMTV